MERRLVDLQEQRENGCPCDIYANETSECPDNAICTCGHVVAVFQSHSRITAQLAGFHGENTQGCLGLHCLNPMMFAMHQAGKLSMCCAALTFDQHLYLKAYRIKDENRHEFQNMTLWLGHFHKLMSFLRSGCKLMEGSGLEYMWQLSIPET